MNKKLKILSDLPTFSDEIDGDEVVLVEDLREEAKKWIEHYKTRSEEQYWVIQEASDKIEWIKEFFGIEDEDGQD